MSVRMETIAMLHVRFNPRLSMNYIIDWRRLLTYIVPVDECRTDELVEFVLEYYNNEETVSHSKVYGIGGNVAND